MKNLEGRFGQVADELEPFYQILSCYFRNYFRVVSLSEVINQQQASSALRISLLYFCFSKTLHAGLGVLVKYSTQVEGEELVKDEDLFILSLKVLEGYSYSSKMLISLYSLLCNLSIQPLFLERAAQIDLFKHALIHVQTHWRSTSTMKLVMRLFKYTLRSGK